MKKIYMVRYNGCGILGIFTKLEDAEACLKREGVDQLDQYCEEYKFWVKDENRQAIINQDYDDTIEDKDEDDESSYCKSKKDYFEIFGGTEAHYYALSNIGEDCSNDAYDDLYDKYSKVTIEIQEWSLHKNEYTYKR